MIWARTISTVAVAGFASAACAGPVVFKLGDNYGAVDPSGPAPWATITIDDNGSANSATMTVQSHLQQAGEFWAGFYLNFDPSLDLGGLSITYNSGQAPVGAGNLPLPINIGPADSFSAGSGGLYDIALSYENSNNPDRFTLAEFTTYDVAYSGVGQMFAQAFDFFGSVGGGNGPFKAVGRVRGTGPGNQGSGWIAPGDPGSPIIPLPSAALLGLAGMTGIAGVRRRTTT